MSSENPFVASIIGNIQAQWDYAFRAAQRLLDRHAPEKFDTDKDRAVYFSHLPVIAMHLYGEFQQAAHFAKQANQQEQDAYTESMAVLFSELKKRDK